MVSNTHRVLNLLRLFQTLCEESIENENSTFHETGSILRFGNAKRLY